MTTVRTTVRTTPARARTDAAAAHAVTEAIEVRAPIGAPAREPGGPSPARIRLAGVGLALGAGAAGVTAIAAGANSFAFDIGGTFFQLGLFGLLATMLATRATGTSRLARTMIIVEFVVLGIATVQSLSTLPAQGGEWGTVAQVLDPFWPLSMLGMAIIGVKVAVAGRWRGALRAWPVVAETWVFVAVPAMALLGSPIGDVVGGVHFLVGYGVLGALLALRPGLARR
jgi:hypothetical protein